MVNPILPRLLGVSDEPVSLKIPGHTTHLTMIIESRSTDDHECGYSARVRSRNQYLSISRATTFLDVTLIMAKISLQRNRPLYVQPTLQIESAYLPLQQKTIFRLFHYRIVGFDARAQRVRIILSSPGATAVIHVFCVRLRHTLMILRYLCLALTLG